AHGSSNGSDPARIVRAGPLPFCVADQASEADPAPGTEQRVQHTADEEQALALIAVTTAVAAALVATVTAPGALFHADVTTAVVHAHVTALAVVRALPVFGVGHRGGGTGGDDARHKR